MITPSVKDITITNTGSPPSHLTGWDADVNIDVYRIVSGGTVALGSSWIFSVTTGTLVHGMQAYVVFGGGVDLNGHSLEILGKTFTSEEAETAGVYIFNYDSLAGTWGYATLYHASNFPSGTVLQSALKMTDLFTSGEAGLELTGTSPNQKIAVLPDGTTIQINGTGQIEVVDGSITTDKLYDDAVEYTKLDDELLYTREGQLVSIETGWRNAPDELIINYNASLYAIYSTVVKDINGTNPLDCTIRVNTSAVATYTIPAGTVAGTRTTHAASLPVDVTGITTFGTDINVIDLDTTPSVTDGGAAVFHFLFKKKSA